MLKPENRVVMITGANRGIGLAIATVLSEAGYKLSLGVRNPTEFANQSFAGEVIIHHYDALDTESQKLWTNETQAHYGQIDAVVLNAGVMVPVGFQTGDESDLDLMWCVNFKAPFKLVRCALGALKKSGHGRVINIVSLSGKRVLGSENLGYSASKFAALSLTHAIRQEGWDDGLRSTAICPGLVDTDMVSHVEATDGTFKITPSAIAATHLYALSLPNDASVAEILVNSRLEPAL